MFRKHFRIVFILERKVIEPNLLFINWITSLVWYDNMSDKSMKIDWSKTIQINRIHVRASGNLCRLTDTQVLYWNT